MRLDRQAPGFQQPFGDVTAVFIVLAPAPQFGGTDEIVTGEVQLANALIELSGLSRLHPWWTPRCPVSLELASHAQKILIPVARPECLLVAARPTFSNEPPTKRFGKVSWAAAQCHSSSGVPTALGMEASRL